MTKLPLPNSMVITVYTENFMILPRNSFCSLTNSYPHVSALIPPN